MSSKPRRIRISLNRSEILIAAEQIVKSEGVGQLSMSNLAERLSCSVVSPYAHFENLEEIIKSLLIRGKAKLTNILRESVRNSQDSYQERGGIIRGYWRFAQENKKLYNSCFIQVMRSAW